MQCNRDSKESGLDPNNKLIDVLEKIEKFPYTYDQLKDDKHSHKYKSRARLYEIIPTASKKNFAVIDAALSIWLMVNGDINKVAGLSLINDLEEAEVSKLQKRQLHNLESYNEYITPAISSFSTEYLQEYIHLLKAKLLASTQSNSPAEINTLKLQKVLSSAASTDTSGSSTPSKNSLNSSTLSSHSNSLELEAEVKHIEPTSKHARNISQVSAVQISQER